MDTRPGRVFPRHLLELPQIIHALAKRDFTPVFAAAKAAGLSYNAIAAACEMKTERVSLIARGSATVTSIDTVERIADGLHIPGGMVGLAARCWEKQAASHPPSNTGDDPMKRRQLLRGALAAGLTSTSLMHIAEARQGGDRALTTTDTVDIAHIESAAEQHSYGYRGRPPVDVLANLVAEFSEITPLLRRPQRASGRVRLAHLAGMVAGMAAVVLHDLGNRREAHAWFRTAARAAEESGDRTLHAWVLAREAMVPLNFGAPRTAANLAEQARQIAGRGTTAAATLATAVAARAYASSGQRDKALAALTEADRLADHLPGDERADSWFGHCEQKHQVHLSHALTSLGETARARQHQAQALTLSAPTSSLTRALIRLDAAMCDHRDGNTIDGCQAATLALAELPARFRTDLTRKRALDLYRDVPTRFRALPEVEQFRAVLTP
ncbi:hypothetical protein [Micromonospora sp. WMMD712]|uniref:hypothetical protein n=1 Tax=Micromonospora sp. WMMD712 TaxID=3016096 RepID=UPI00249C5367|nr:hypothetical protein [Micromonospora sp. WMMD712]WFE60607.1 hypothetical protein O7633_28850 [Micromonospora sp. WMMD712]